MPARGVDRTVRRTARRVSAFEPRRSAVGGGNSLRWARLARAARHPENSRTAATFPTFSEHAPVMADDRRTLEPSQPSKQNHTRAVVRRIAMDTERPLTAAEIRARALHRDRSLEPLAVALAVADLRNRGEIRVAL